jgi:hypothetical protein
MSAIKNVVFYFIVLANWLLAFFVLIFPTNKYEWMYDEYGKGTVLPEDHSSLSFFAGILAAVSIISAITSALFGWRILPNSRTGKTWIGIAITPALLMFVKLLMR